MPKPITDRDLYRYDLTYGAPELVKSASVSRLLAQDASDITFADPDTQVYAIHNPGATWVSTAHFLESSNRLSPAKREKVAKRLAEAARSFHIEAEVAELQKKHASMQQIDRDTLDDSSFGWLVKNAAGKIVDRRLRLLNSTEVKVAGEYLLANRDVFDLGDRMTIAQRIIRRAEKLAAEIDPQVADQLDRIAGFGETTLSLVKAAVDRRITLVKAAGKDPEVVTALQAMYKAIAAKPGLLNARDERVKLADALSRFDRTIGLAADYAAADLERPEDTLFAITEKVAIDFIDSHVALKSGSIFSKADLARLSLETIANVMGEKYADAMTTDNVTLCSDTAATLLPEMTAAQAKQFEKAAAAVGIVPVLRKQAAAPRLTTADLIRLIDEKDQPKTT